MGLNMLKEKIRGLLDKREFLSIATCDLSGHPNAAPKFFLKFEDNHIYLVDYTMSRTWENLKINPRASLSFVDTRSLAGYQINGPVKIIDKGKEYDKLLKEKTNRQIGLTAKHIIEELRGGERHEDFELSIPDKFVIFKVRIDDVVEIGLRGDLKRE